MNSEYGWSYSKIACVRESSDGDIISGFIKFE